MFEPLRREFHLSDTELGALTTVFTLLYAVAGLPLGRLGRPVKPPKAARRGREPCGPA